MTNRTALCIVGYICVSGLYGGRLAGRTEGRTDGLIDDLNNTIETMQVTTENQNLQ